MATCSNSSYRVYCVICFEPFTTTSVLRCFHTICENCLYQSSSNASEETSSTVKCPICKNTTNIPHALSAEVRTSPASSLNNDNSNIPSSTSTDPITCDACRRDSEHVTAIYWCKECSEALCMDCKLCHKKNKFTQGHDTVDINIVSCLLKGPLMNIDTTCNEHDRKDLDVYCFDHRQLCCVVGSATDHRTCHYVKPLSCIVNKMSDDYFPSMMLLLGRMKSETSTILTENESNLTKLDTIEVESISKVSRLVRDAKTKLDDLEKTCQSEILQVCQKHKTFLLDRNKQLKQLETNFQNCSKTVDVLKEHATKEHGFISMERLKKQLISHYEHVQYHLINSPSMKVDVQIDTNLFQSIQASHAPGTITESYQNAQKSSDSLKQMRDITKKMECLPSRYDYFDMQMSSDLTGSLVKTGPLDNDDSSFSMSSENWRTDLSVKCSVTEVKAIPCPIVGNQTVNATSGAFLSDGRLLLLDSTSRHIMMFDYNYKFMRSLKIEGTPICIAVDTKDNFVYVALHSNILLKCTIESSKLLILKELRIPKGISCLAASSDYIYVGTNEGVILFTVDGKEIKKVSCGQGYQVIAISPEQQTFFSKEGDNIICESLEGSVKFQYTNMHLRNVSGLSLDRYGNIFVCGSDSRNVYEICQDGKTSRALVQNYNSFTGQNAIFYHPIKEQFIITCTPSPWDTTPIIFKVFQLSG